MVETQVVNVYEEGLDYGAKTSKIAGVTSKNRVRVVDYFMISDFSMSLFDFIQSGTYLLGVLYITVCTVKDMYIYKLQSKLSVKIKILLPLK